MIWEIVGRAKLSTIVPPFSGVIAAGITIIPTAKFSAAVAISLRSFALGMALALLVGIPIGVLMARVAEPGQYPRPVGQYFHQRADLSAGAGADGADRHR